MNLDPLHEIDTALRWSEHFTRLQGCAKLIEICNLVDPTLDIEIEKALQDILSKRSQEMQQKLKTLSLLHADKRPDNMSDHDHRIAKEELDMEFSSAEVMFKYAAKFDDVKTAPKYFKWMLKSAKLGFHGAQNNVGYCYIHGFGTQINYEQAFYWSKKSAPHNDHAMLRMAHCYLNGYGIEFNLETAYEIFYKLKRFIFNHPLQMTSQLYFLKGICEKIDTRYQKAFDYFAMACDTPGYESQAQYELALCFLQGRGCHVDESKALSLLKKSASKQFLPAISKLRELE